MKYFLLVFAILYTRTRTCYAKNVSLLHVVFVSSLVDPNEHEIDELTNLVRFPLHHVMSEESSLISDIGLVEKYSVVFSSQPDEITTSSGAEIENYSPRHFRQLVRNRTANSIGAASLKGLRKALEISSRPSLVVLATNTEPADTHLLAEILEAMVNKTNPVIVLHIDGKWNSSIYNHISTHIKTYSVEKLVRTIFHQNKTLDREYAAIMEVSKTLLLNSGIQMVSEKYNLLMNYNPGYVETLVFACEIFKKADDQYLSKVSESMESDVNIYFKQLKTNSRNENYSVVFPTNRNTTFLIQAFSNYTSKDFQNMIRSQNNNLPAESSLRSLLQTLQIIPVSSWIVYYFDSEPKDRYDFLPEVVQLIIDKRIKITFKPFGGGLSSSGNGLVYRTIRDASRIARSSGSSAWTNCIASVVIFVRFVIVNLV